MATLSLVKRSDCTFVAVDAANAVRARKLGVGEIVDAEVRFSRNRRFARKFFALITYGFECWEPAQVTYKGEVVAKEFDRFRKDITILAGYGDPVVNIRGEVRIEARSIAFGKMDDEEFAKLYSAVIDVLLARVLRNHSREDVETVVMAFA